MLADGTQHPAGIADCYNIGGNILCHNASCANHSVVPDGNTRHHDHASTQPTVATDADGQIVLVYAYAFWASFSRKAS